MHRVIQKGTPGRGVLLAGSLFWVCLIVFGTKTLMTYENRAAAAGTSPAKWPADSGIQRSASKFVLVMVVHPDCPCSKASLVELAELMARLDGKLAAFILFSKPEASEQEVRASELWNRAARIPGVHARYDGHALESVRFGGLISGQTMLYNPDGRLVFAGGLTRARGQEGYSMGTDAVILKVSGNPNAPANTPVFGCSLRDPDTKELKEDPAWKKR